MISLRRALGASLVLASLILHFSLMSAEVRTDEDRIYIGTYTGKGTSRGIYTATFEAGSGKLGAPELAAETTNPSFLALHPKRRLLYAVGEMDRFEGKRSGAVAAYEIGANGKLTFLNRKGSEGTGPCHLSVDGTGRWVLVANYGSGSVAALAIEPDGRLAGAGPIIQNEGSSINRERQAGPHAHYIAPDPGNAFVLSCDLGLDEVLVYRLGDQKPVLVPNNPPFVKVTPGSGPRHLAFHPDGRHVYLANELASTLTVFEYQAASGTLKELQTAAMLPPEFKGQTTAAEVQVHPSGKFVYASNRGHDTLAVFAVEEKSGKLALVQHQSSGGRTPRHFALDPSGRWLLSANQDSDNIVVFSVAADSGRLTPTGQEVKVGAPVCVVFDRH